MTADHNQRMTVDLSSTPLPHGAVRLHDWGVIRAAGADARGFLHGQLTQDVIHLERGQARLAGYCSPKGRLIASFVVWCRGDDEILLACSADLLPAALKRLSMFVLRAKCRLSDASAELPLWGLAGDAAAVALGDKAQMPPWACTDTAGADLIRLPNAMNDGSAVPRWLWAGGEPPALPALAPADWNWLEVHSGVARVVGANVEQFVPQMVNLELVGGVNFQKGCYPGQEVVARSQYRGTLKRRAQVVDSPVALQPGQEVFHDGDPDQPAGRVVLAGTRAGVQHAALVELKLSALGSGHLHAGAAEGPRLTLAALPYEIPAEAG
jgi:folate-binding protein YgfZ